MRGAAHGLRERDILSAYFLAAFALKKVLDAAPTDPHSSYLLNKATGLFNTQIKCRLRDTYSYLLYR
jgi:hypothetical protein